MPSLHVEDFKSVKKFNVFNTNNLWINLPAIKRIIEENTLDMEVIVNPKSLGINYLNNIWTRYSTNLWVTFTVT